jgi:hypothetical protein
MKVMRELFKRGATDADMAKFFKCNHYTVKRARLRNNMLRRDGTKSVVAKPRATLKVPGDTVRAAALLQERFSVPYIAAVTKLTYSDIYRMRDELR